VATVTGTLVTNGTQTLVGMREDLAEFISRTDPAETPFYSFCDEGTAKNSLAHDWQTVDLRNARRVPRPEGDTVTLDTPKKTVKLSNACEIIRGEYGISGTAQAVDTAGDTGSMNFQRLHFGMELRKDVEFMLLGPQNKKATDTRESAGIQAFAGVFSYGSGATTPGTGASAGTVDVTQGTARDLTMDILNTGLRSAWTGGARTSVMFMSSAQKMGIDEVLPTDQLATGQSDLLKDGVLVATTVAVWRSAFGDVKFVMDRILDEGATDAAGDPITWGTGVIIGVDERGTYRPKVCTLPGRKFKTEPLGKRGDIDEELVVWEGTLEVPNPAAIAVIGGLNDPTA
jgi:hypothetical protein